MNKYKTIDEFLDDLNDDKKAQVLQLRDYILTAHPGLTEHIKWNAPSYVLNDEDRITFNLNNKEQAVKLVFHMGALKKEDKKAEPILKNADLIEWVSDIRGYATFKSLDEIISNERALKKIIKDWLLIN